MSAETQAVLAEWVAAGGSHHGPNVETVTMPLADYVKFRASIVAVTDEKIDRALTAYDEFLGYDDEADYEAMRVALEAAAATGEVA